MAEPRSPSATMLDKAYLDGLLASQGHLSQHGDDRPNYFNYHRMRFIYVMDTCIAICPDRSAEVLDIGFSHLSGLLLTYYRSVTTLGFPVDEDTQRDIRATTGAADDFAGHILYDLNDAQTLKAIATDRRFDIIVFGEVIEHLHTAPEIVLHALRQLLKPGGHIVCQTPNATAIHKRLKLLLGMNPYERIRFDPTNPGHFREYTKAELIEAGATAGLATVRHEYKDYFGISGGLAKRLGLVAYKLIIVFLPQLSRGQTIIFQRPEERTRAAPSVFQPHEREPRRGRRPGSGARIPTWT